MYKLILQFKTQDPPETIGSPPTPSALIGYAYDENILSANNADLATLYGSSDNSLGIITTVRVDNIGTLYGTVTSNTPKVLTTIGENISALTGTVSSTANAEGGSTHDNAWWMINFVETECVDNVIQFSIYPPGTWTGSQNAAISALVGIGDAC